MIVLCAFHFWLEDDEESGEGDWLSRHEYVIMRLSSSVTDTAPMNLNSLRALFSMQHGEAVPLLYWGKDNKSFYLGYQEDMMQDDNYYYGGAFTISYLTGKKLITDSHYDWLSSVHEPWLANQNPADVFGYWMGTPQIDPYPDPFNPPLYRFISYVERSGDLSMSIDYNLIIRNQTIEVDFDRSEASTGYLVAVMRYVSGVFRIFCNQSDMGGRVQCMTSSSNYNNVKLIEGYDLSRHCIVTSGNDGIIKYYIDGSLKQTLDLSSGLPSSFSYPLQIMLGTISDAKYKLYGLRIYDTATGEMRVNLRPAIRLADFKYGLYDEVRDIFFTDPALTGG